MGWYTWKGKRKYGRKGSVTGKPPKYFVNEVEVTKEEFELAFPDKGISGGTECLPGHLPACWPMRMDDSLGVHPAQVDAANARAKAHGIDATYEKGTGNVVIGSRRDRAK